MSPEEERAFLAPWLQQAKEGGVLTVPPLHAALEETLGRKIPLSTTYRLLSRHGWRKVSPDTKHPKSRPEDQEEFKKYMVRAGCQAPFGEAVPQEETDSKFNKLEDFWSHFF